MSERPEWFDAWTKPCEPPIPPDGVAWMRERPESVKRVMRVFPPSCVVQDATGCYGIVASIYESGDVSIRHSPDDKRRFWTPTKALTIVGYYHGLTPEKVLVILDTTL